MINVDLKHFPSKIKKAKSIALIGNGGNLAVAQHMASDLIRHTGKFCFAPDSVHTTALGGDGDWKKSWVKEYAKNAELVIGITCRKNSGVSNSIMEVRDQCDTLLIAPLHHDTLDTLVIPTKTYHEFECTALWTIYRMMEHVGVELPILPHIK